MSIQGIQIWACSYCRSMLAFYEGLGLAYQVPIRVCLTTGENPNRTSLGWDADEFSHLDVVVLGSDSRRAYEELEAYKQWNQLFGAYQANTLFQGLILQARSLVTPVGVCSEAPLNMLEPSLKRVAKDFYMAKRLPKRMKPYVAASDFVINLSGSDCRPFLKLGWQAEKVIPCGYFPPPLDGSSLRTRKLHPDEDFHILCTGGMTWHRGQGVLIRALELLKRWGVQCRVTMTQSGLLEGALKQSVAQLNLPVDFVGMLPMADLIELMEKCACYVATGREEPWGIRVNDALHCGAPILVSRGMGACQVVDDFGCGLSYNADDHVDLAWKLRRLICDREIYESLASRVADASNQSMPHNVAGKIVQALRNNFSGWYGSHE